MKFRRILSGILAATVAVSSLAVSSFTAYGEDAPSDVVTPDSGSWKNTTASNSAKLDLVSNFGTGEVISKLAEKTEIYVTFDVTGVDSDTEAFLPIAVKNSVTHWNADDNCPLVETPTDGTYTVKYSGDAISADAVFNYLGVNFKTKSSSGKTDKKVTSITLKYVTLTDPSKAEPPAGDDPEPTDYIFDYTYGSNDSTYGEVYRATLKSNYVELLQQHNTTEIVFPEEYDDQGEHGKLPVVWLSFRLGDSFTPDEYVTSIILNSKIYNTGSGYFAYAKKLEKVVFKYSGDSFEFNRLGYRSASAYSDSIKEIYLYATDLKSVNTDAFREMNKDLKIYVTNNTVKQKLLDSTKESTYYQLKDEQVIVMGSKPAEPDPTDYIFDYSYSAGTQVYYASLKANYIELLKEKNTTEIVFPEEYDDQTNGKHPVDTLSFKIGSRSTPDEYVTSITFNSNISSAGSGTFACAKKLEKVVYKYSGDAFKVDRMAYNVLLGNSDSIKEIYLYATGLSSVDKDAFRAMNTDLKIYVTNSAVKQKLLDSTKESTQYQLKDEQVIIMESSDPIDYTELDKAIESAEDIVTNHSEEYSEESLNALKTELEKARKLKDGSAVQGDVDLAVKSLNASIEGLVTKKVAELKEQLQTKITEGESVKKNLYTPTSYQAFTEALNAARLVVGKEKLIEQDVQTALDNLTAAAAVDETGLAETGLKKRASLSKVSEFQKHHNSAIRSNRGSYTEDSWTEYQKVLDEYEKVYTAADASDCDATDQQIDKAMSDLDAAAKNLKFIPLNEEEYKKAKEAVEALLAEENSPYTPNTLTSLRNLYEAQTGSFYNAAIERNSQNELDQITQRLKDAIDPSSSSYILAKKGDTTALQPLVDDCAKLVESDYTLDSWKLVKDKLDAAQALLDDPDNAGEEDIATTKDELTKAIEALVVDYSEGEKTSGIGKLMPLGKETTLDSGKADESMAGAVKIRYIFDCAADTDFSEYTTIDATAVINGTNNYKQFKGNNNQKGAKDCSVTLDLASAIEVGDSYTIKADTYAWNEAADYVYLVTRIEYLDAEGKVLKMFTGGGETAKLDKYKKAIEDAKALVESGEYTEESVAALQTAIDNAQALLDETEGKPLPSQMEDPAAALDEAVKALVALPKGDISGTIKTPGTDAEVTVTVATADGETVAEATAANGEYSISDLEDGEYIVTFAADGYAARSYTAAVAGGSVTLEAEIHLYGDVNGDGEITTADAGMANSHAREVSALEGYDFDVAEVTGDGEVTTADVGVINATAQGI